MFLFVWVVFVIVGVNFGKVSNGINVSIGIMVMFWVSNMLNEVWLLFDFNSLCFESVCSIIVVDESDNIKFIVRVVC